MSLGGTDMVSKNNHQFYQQKYAERKQRWGLRKLSVGVASVLLGTTFMLYSNHAVSADTVPTTTPTDATVQTDSNVADHQSSEVTLRTTADKEETVATTTNAEEKVVATNTQDTTQDKDKQTNANETTQNTTKVGNEVMPANGVTIRKKFVRAALPVREAEAPDPTQGQNPTQDKDKQTNANETTKNTTNVDKKDLEVTPANGATPLKKFVLAARRLLVMKEASPSLPMSNQDIKLDSQPMLTEITNKPTDNWVYKNLKSFPDSSTAKVKEILQNHTTNDESGRYYFAGVANYNESLHAIYLLARSNNLNDNNLYVTILHTGLYKNIQEAVVAPGESKRVPYRSTTHTPIFTNYDGTSVSIDLDGVEKGDKNQYGMVVGFAYGYDTRIFGDSASMGNGFMTTPMPTKMTTTIHYIDQATGDELAAPKSFEGVGYQKYTITGEAPTIDGYTLKQSPETTGYISPYKVGESYDFRLDKHVVIKQTVIDAQGLIRITAYYDGEAINNTTRYLGTTSDNDLFSFVSHGKSYTYINQITSTNDGIVYYYAKDGSEDKSEVRVHYIDVTGNKNAIFVPGDGKEVATDKISGKLGENYNYNVNLPTDYNLATNQANTVNGTYTIYHHDEYVYVVKKTSPATSATKAAAKDAIDQAAKTKDDAIDASNLTAEEKDTLKQTVAGEVNKAKAAIDAATKDADVKTAQTTGEKAINNINVPDTSATKDAAKNAIDQAAKAKNDAIDASNLTDEEKADLKKQVAGEVQKAKSNIDAATKDADVKTAQTNGEKAINAVEIPTSSKTKNDANSDLDNTADAAKNAIDETSGLTDDQKQTAKDQIDTAVGDAQENIKKASDNQGVADAKDAGKLAIDKVSAKAAIDAALNNKKSAIAKAPLTAEEAKPLNDLVDQEADAAKAAIDDATTNAVVEAAKNNGVEKINNINVPTTSATKDAANKAIENALAKKIEEIKANTNLTDDQKQSLIDQAQNAANQAKENVRSASTDEDVQTAKNNRIAAINGITVKSNSVDDQDNSATNEGNGNQAGHIQSDNSSDVTKHSSIQQSGNEKTQLPQTGNETQRGAGLVGLAIVGLVGLLGSAGFRKKRD